MRRFGVVLLALALVGLAGCQTAGPSQAAQDAAREALSKEVEVGKAALAKLAGTYGVVKDREATEFLNLYLKSLALYVERQNLPYQVAILDTDQVNAYSLPGGYILITRGALRAIREPGALAGVLAHELGHINRNHLVNAVKIRVQYSALETLARVLAGSRQLITASINQINDKIQEKLFLEGFAADSEYEADAYAASLLAAAGIDSTAYLRFLEELSTQVSTDDLADIDRTHPPLSTRTARLQPLIEPGLPPLEVTPGFQAFLETIHPRENQP